MPPSKQQRRSKQSKSAAAQPPLQEQLANAQAAIEQSRQGIETLHQQWKSHLLRLSYIVIFVSIHQAIPGLSKCWEDTGHLLEAEAEEKHVITDSISKRILFVAGDSLMQIVAIVMSLLLAHFLRASNAANLFSERSSSFLSSSVFMGHSTFLLASACTPVLVGLYSLERHNHQSQEPHQPTATARSCLKTAWFLQRPFVDTATTTAYSDRNSPNGEDDAAATESQTVRPGFPVVVIFSILVTACYWFMEHQARQQERNRQAVLKVRHDLMERKKKQ